LDNTANELEEGQVQRSYEDAVSMLDGSKEHDDDDFVDCFGVCAPPLAGSKDPKDKNKDKDKDRSEDDEEPNQEVEKNPPKKQKTATASTTSAATTPKGKGVKAAKPSASGSAAATSKASPSKAGSSDQDLTFYLLLFQRVCLHYVALSCLKFNIICQFM